MRVFVHNLLTRLMSGVGKENSVLRKAVEWIAPPVRKTTVVAVREQIAVNGAVVGDHISINTLEDALGRGAIVARYVVETRAVCWVCERVRCVVVGCALGVGLSAVMTSEWWLLIGSVALMALVLVAKSTDVFVDVGVE